MWSLSQIHFFHLTSCWQLLIQWKPDYNAGEEWRKHVKVDKEVGTDGKRSEGLTEGKDFGDEKDLRTFVLKCLRIFWEKSISGEEEIKDA